MTCHKSFFNAIFRPIFTNIKFIILLFAGFLASGERMIIVSHDVKF